MITLYGTIRTAPDAATVEVQASGETYDEARAALDAQVPTETKLLGISRWPTA
ncbi:hypothetical protein P5P86_11695 [Nocardioides sp. BP30]|uniref:hypothetical protein n=1 Tax=Nocardioides sp. BP30 TaxID=3036374 RepID=UPI002468A003|nr:hypothetical protein [Nocardioides sp. BP30]WGL50627.1 hypothetical protein P5P86_11695 [Nocardioides sp. BP30]